MKLSFVSQLSYRNGSTIDHDAVEDLVLTITSDGDLYRTVARPIIENLQKKVVKGTYDKNLAVKAWQRLADLGAQQYDKDFGSGKGSLKMFNPATRAEVAKELMEYYEDEVNRASTASYKVS